MIVCVLNYTEIHARKLDNTHWYGHVPKPVEKIHEGKVTIVWNQQVRTDRTFANNKLRNIIPDN
jgi:hypothetical protein